MIAIVLVLALTLSLTSCTYQTCTTYLVRPSALGLTAPTTSCVIVKRP